MGEPISVGIVACSWWLWALVSVGCAPRVVRVHCLQESLDSGRLCILFCDFPHVSAQELILAISALPKNHGVEGGTDVAPSRTTNSSTSRQDTCHVHSMDLELIAHSWWQIWL